MKNDFPFPTYYENKIVQRSVRWNFEKFLMKWVWEIKPYVSPLQLALVSKYSFVIILNQNRLRGLRDRNSWVLCFCHPQLLINKKEANVPTSTSSSQYWAFRHNPNKKKKSVPGFVSTCAMNLAQPFAWSESEGSLCQRRTVVRLR